MHKLFLSHVAEESELAGLLKDWIESTFAGQCTVFVSSSGDDLRPGMNWLNQLDSALEVAEVLLVLCSPFSINRTWINFETGCAWNKKIPILPICHSGLSKDRLPQPLAQFQAIELADLSFSKSLIKSLADYFEISRLPRISHDQMMKELQNAESIISKSYVAQSSSPKNEIQADSSKPSSGKRSDRNAPESAPSVRPLRLILTTKLTEDNDPVKSVKGFSMNDEKAYFYIKWFQLTAEKDYKMNWQLLDQEGNIVDASEFVIHPKSSNWNTWHSYSFKKNIDEPGNWTFMAYLDGNKVLEKKFEVTLL